MSGSANRWLKGCAMGCGGLLLLLGLGLGIVTARTCVPLRSADRDLEALEMRFGPPDTFKPAADGSISDDRLRVFLDVRRKLEQSCSEFTAMLTKMDRVDTMEDTENISGSEIAESTQGFAGVSVDIAPAIGRFFERRNAALLEAGMGLGEYAYIFALAYREELTDPTLQGGVFFEEHAFPPEVQEWLRAIFAHQLEEVRESGPPALAPDIERELRELEATPGHLPWRDGLPSVSEGSLATWREEIERGFCRATAGIALDRTSRRALILALY